MIRISRIIRLVVLCCADLVARAYAQPFDPGKIIERVVCRADSSQSYALYIPLLGRGASGGGTGDAAPLPILYFFDSHGSGALPLRKYRALAEAYGFILVGSNNSRNGNDWSATEAIWGRLFDDTQKRLRIMASRVYTCGFSGGAKVASYLAIQHSVIKGVIANGAALPDGVSAGDFAFSFTAIAGEGDMNMTELVAVTNGFDRTRTRHRILFFDGKHEWAPEATMRTAFEGLQFDAMRTRLIPRDDKAVTAYIAGSKRRLDADKQAGLLIKAHQECVLSVELLDGLTGEAGWFGAQAAAIEKDPRYLQQQQGQANILALEEKTKTGYMQQFQQGDISYWTTTIDDLRNRAAEKTAQRAMYQRLLAYLSLAFYSISNQLINAGQNDQARHFVELYKVADPANSEAWYFSAVLRARAGDGHGAGADLLKAAGYGFNDEARLRQQPEFQRLAGQIGLSTVESRMRLNK
jgi:pimeloyl-ACP methyl ester carboxylesterase